jgi:hypothetical protein
VRRGLQTRENILFKEGAGGFGREGESLAIHGYAYAILAVAHTELTGKLNLIIQLILFHQTLQFLDDLAGTLQMAAGSDADGNFHGDDLLPYYGLLIINNINP